MLISNINDLFFGHLKADSIGKNKSYLNLSINLLNVAFVQSASKVF
jgi:hypothetical protein